MTCTSATRINTTIPFYAKLLAKEKKHPNREDGMIAVGGMVTDLLSNSGKEYDEFIFTL